MFGDGADRIVVTNTKGFTGHPMGVGIEDGVAVKALETGSSRRSRTSRAGPGARPLNLSNGRRVPAVEYALRLAAGFGSQISMTLLRRIAVPDGRRRRRRTSSGTPTGSTSDRLVSVARAHERPAEAELEVVSAARCA